MKPFCFILALLCLAGCASNKPNARSIDWNARLGSYTYDQALAEFGPPDITGESAGGRQLEWVIRRSPQMSFGVGVGSGGYSSHSGVGVGVGTSVSPPARGEYLRLVFDQDNLLKDWLILKH